MSLLLHNAVGHPSSIELYEKIGSCLGVPICHGELGDAWKPFQVLVSNHVVPPAIRSRIRSYGGILLSRPRSMSLLQRGGLPVMKWSLAENVAEVKELFTRWESERLILKRSFSYGGEGVSVFGLEHVEKLEWDGKHDLFCAEVNPNSGDVYKAELFNGEMMISWLSEAPPLKEVVEGGVLRGVKGAYGERRLFEFPPEIERQLCRVSEMLTRDGVGYVSIDLMKTADGDFRAIEINLSLIATWWTTQFGFMKERYAGALSRLYCGS